VHPAAAAGLGDVENIGVTEWHGERAGAHSYSSGLGLILYADRYLAMFYGNHLCGMLQWATQS